MEQLLNDVMLGARESNTNRISSNREKRSQVYRRDAKQNSLGVWRDKKVLCYSCAGQGGLWKRDLEGWVEVFHSVANI